MTARLSLVLSESRGSRLPALLLAVAAVLAAVLPFFDLVTAADGSATAAPVGGAWIAVLPAVAALVGLAIRPELGVALVGGAGAVAVSRLAGDFGLLLDPDSILRPEWFGVASVSAFPLRSTPAGWLPLLADALAIGALAFAARVLFEMQPPVERLDERVRIPRAVPFTVVGLIGAGLVTVAALSVPYASPVPVVRPLGVPDIGVFGTLGAALLAVMLSLVVVFAASLPPLPARGLVVGAGLATAVPGMTAVAAAAPASWSAWTGLAGAALLCAAAALRRDSGGDQKTHDEPRDASTTRPPAASVDGQAASGPLTLQRIVVGGLALLAAGAAVMAAVRPQATVSGVDAGTSFDAAGAGFLPVAVLLVLGGLAVLLPPTAALGCRWLGMFWAPAAAALLTALEFVSSSIWVNTAVFVNFTGVASGPGAGWGVAAALLAIGTAIAAGVLGGRLADRATKVVDVDRVDRASALRTGTGLVLSAGAVVALALPVFRANGRNSAALFTGEARIDGYGQWLMLLTVLVACWLAVRSVSRSAAAGLLTGVALILAGRLWLPGAVRSQPEFTVSMGFWVTAGCAAAALVAAAVLWRAIGTAPLLPPTVWGTGTRPAAAAGAGAPKSGRGSVSPRGKRR